MSKKVLIVDTCLACVWMKVPEMEVAGPDNDRWDYDRVNAKIESEIAEDPENETKGISGTEETEDNDEQGTE